MLARGAFYPLGKVQWTSQGENAFLWGSQRVLGPYDFAMPGTAIVQGIARFALAKSVTLALSSRAMAPNVIGGGGQLHR